MIFLFLSIFFSTILLVYFKFFEKYRVNLLQAIVFNYITASVTGFLMSGITPEPQKWLASPWFFYAALIGLIFIVLFFILGVSSQKAGITITSVANKMSLVIPVTIAFILYNEPVTAYKIAGIALALAGIWFTSQKSGASLLTDKRSLLLPLLIFAGSGISDALINHVNKNFSLMVTPEYFTAVLFTSSAFFGIIFLSFDLLNRKNKLQLKNILWGIALGVPNYFSIHFLFLALKESPWDSSVVYPLNNMGIVVLSALFGIAIYKERFSIVNWIGILISIAAIAIISFGQ
ncbi:MAG: EamA family transporter [Bacteroidota bacterium]